MVKIRQVVIGWIVMMIICTLGLTKAEAITLVSTQQEIEIGRGVVKEVEKHYRLVEDDALQARVQKIGRNLVAVCDRQNMPYTFKVLDSKEVNAFAVPGGFIYIFKGLVDKMPSDEELAGVIAHELGHVVKRHSIKQMEKSLGLTIGSALLLGDKGFVMQRVVADALMAGFSRDDEREADHLGFMYTLKAGYNPYSTLLGMEKLSETDQPYHSDLFSSHPESRQRINAIHSELTKNKVYPTVKELDNGAAQVVDGNWGLPILYAEDNGYRPKYRACFAAGNLYLVRKLPDYNVEKYILDSDGEKITVYYDDRVIITLNNQDAAAQNMNLMDFAGLYIARLKSWNH